MSARPANPHLASDIISAAASIVEEKGPEGITMREVADRVGYSPTAIYLYFKNKEQLLDETVNRAYEWFADWIEAAGKTGNPLDGLRREAHAYLDWGLGNPAMYRLMFEWGYLGDISPEAIFARRRGWRRSRQLVERAMEEGLLKRSLDSALATDVMWVATHGATSLAISGRMFGNPGVADPAVVSARSHVLVDAAVDGWLTDWAPGRG